MKNNPFSLMFGKEPGQMIDRVVQRDEVVETFLSLEPSQMVYMVAGVRGSGKTVFLTDIMNIFRKQKDWIVLQLNPERDLLQALLAKLCAESAIIKILKNTSLNLSFFGLGVTVERNEPPITDVEAALTGVLEQVKKNGKRVLIAIDEVSNNPNIKTFSAAYQIFVQQELPVFLVMTGLYENIYNLQNEKTLTFLYRAPKLRLRALNIGSMAASYLRTLDISEETARKMAQLTKGYAFAFQVLGYYTFQNDGDYEKAIAPTRLYLEEYVYERIWMDLSARDRKILYVITQTPSCTVMEVREKLEMKPNEFAPYRERLIRKGILDGSERGMLYFSLPFIEEYVVDHYFE
ncbi:MAG: ATP-binding protein [Eubacterium sp.]|nr:ATP-binding protein [Eubacterium sp.]